MYGDFARTILVDDDPAAVEAVERIRSRHPELSQEQVARRLIERAAWRCAAVGAAACGGMELLRSGVAAVDLPYQALTLSRLAAAIARAHRRRTTLAERTLVAGAGLVMAGAGELLRRGVAAAARRAFARRGSTLSPLVCALAGGAAGYAAAKIFARAMTELAAANGGRFLPNR